MIMFHLKRNKRPDRSEERGGDRPSLRSIALLISLMPRASDQRQCSHMADEDEKNFCKATCVLCNNAIFIPTDSQLDWLRKRCRLSSTGSVADKWTQILHRGLQISKCGYERVTSKRASADRLPLLVAGLTFL